MKPQLCFFLKKPSVVLLITEHDDLFTLKLITTSTFSLESTFKFLGKTCSIVKQFNSTVCVNEK